MRRREWGTVMWARSISCSGSSGRERGSARAFWRTTPLPIPCSRAWSRRRSGAAYPARPSRDSAPARGTSSSWPPRIPTASATVMSARSTCSWVSSARRTAPVRVSSWRRAATSTRSIRTLWTSSAARSISPGRSRARRAHSRAVPPRRKRSTSMAATSRSLPRPGVWIRSSAATARSSVPFRSSRAAAKITPCSSASPASARRRWPRGSRSALPTAVCPRT